MRIAIIQGHPDIDSRHLGHALAQAYGEAAEGAGHEVRNLIVAQLSIPMLHDKENWQHGPAPEAAQAAQQVMLWAEHLLIIYPLWLGTMPASFKAFLEQVFRPDFTTRRSNGKSIKRLHGRTARVVVTMGMPGFLYRWFFLAHGLRALVRNVLKFSGISPVRTTMIGAVEGRATPIESKWLPLMRHYGRQAR